MSKRLERPGRDHFMIQGVGPKITRALTSAEAGQGFWEKMFG